MLQMGAHERGQRQEIGWRSSWTGAPRASPSQATKRPSLLAALAKDAPEDGPGLAELGVVLLQPPRQLAGVAHEAVGGRVGRGREGVGARAWGDCNRAGCKHRARRQSSALLPAHFFCVGQVSKPAARAVPADGEGRGRGGELAEACGLAGGCFLSHAKRAGSNLSMPSSRVCSAWLLTNGENVHFDGLAVGLGRRLLAVLVAAGRWDGRRGAMQMHARRSAAVPSRRSLAAAPSRTPKRMAPTEQPQLTHA